jgi:cell division septum initiation protein DivIVA
MEPEWNNPPDLDDCVMLGLRKEIDIDDYINILVRKVDSLESENKALKHEIKTQRKEIAGLREERRAILDNDKPPGLCIDW